MLHFDVPTESDCCQAHQSRTHKCEKQRCVNLAINRSQGPGVSGIHGHQNRQDGGAVENVGDTQADDVQVHGVGSQQLALCYGYDREKVSSSSDKYYWYSHQESYDLNVAWIPHYCHLFIPAHGYHVIHHF